MPQVVVRYRGEKMPEHVRLSLKGMLPMIVAEELTIPEKYEMHLTSKDIGVEFREAGPDDVLTNDIEIGVTANIYPEREQKVQDGAANQMAQRLKSIIAPGRTFYVWVKLVKASFVEAIGTGGAPQG